MRIEQLEYLVAISKQGSMKAASETLFVSHQAISDAIRQLEEEVNHTLVTRTNKGTQLTKEGWQIVHLAEPFLNDWDNLKALLQSGKEGATDIALYTDAICNTHHIAPVKVRFHQLHPYHGLQIHETAFDDAVSALAQDPHAVAVFSISSDDIKHIPDTLEYSILTEYILCAIVHKQSALAKQKLLSFRDFIGVPVVAYSDEVIYDGYDMLAEYWQRYCPDAPLMRPEAVSIQVKERLLQSNSATGIRYQNARQIHVDPFPNCTCIPMKEQEKNFLVCLYNPMYYPTEILEWLGEFY